MPTTSTHDFPYPAGTDSPDVPYWLQQLAEGVDGAVPIIATGSVAVPISASDSGFEQVDISSYGFTTTPTFVGICSNYSYYAYRSTGGTQSNTTIAVGARHFQGTTATTSVTVYWVAIGT